MMNKEIRFYAYLTPPQKNVYTGLEGHPYKDLENDNYITDEHYQNILDCGFAYGMGLFEDRAPECFLEALTMASRHNIKYFVKDPFKPYSVESFINNQPSSGKSCSEFFKEYEKELRARFDEYSKHTAFFGLLAIDEPAADKFEAIRFIQDWFEENYPGLEFEVNLLPNYANPYQLSGREGIQYSYEQHIEDFCRIVKPQLLSYDFYVLNIDRKANRMTLSPGFLRNMEIIAKKGQELNVPYYNFLLTIGHLYFRTPEKYSEIAFQVYPALAYGFSGFQTFTYWTLLGSQPDVHITHGVVHQDGKLSPTYFAMKEVISEVKFFEKEFCRYNWREVMCVNADENKPNIFFAGLKHAARELKEIDKIKTTEDIIVGRFEDGADSTALLLSNVSDPQYEQGAKIDILFKGKREGTVYYRNTKKSFSGEDLTIYLSCGSGAFVVLKG